MSAMRKIAVIGAAIVLFTHSKMLMIVIIHCKPCEECEECLQQRFLLLVCPGILNEAADQPGQRLPRVPHQQEGETEAPRSYR